MANVSDTEASFFLDLHLSISDYFVKIQDYDIRDDFDFDIVHFSFLDGAVPLSTSYGVYIFQIIRVALVSSHVDDFNTRNKVLTAKLLKDIEIINLVKVGRKTLKKNLRRFQSLSAAFLHIV